MKTMPALLFCLSLLSGCASMHGASTAPVVAGNGVDAFLNGLRKHCGRAYAGHVMVDVPAAANSPFAGKPLTMHVRECGDDAVRVPFHVGTDRSRTWVFTRTAPGLRLKHDHRHEDGHPDAVTLYGGDSAATRVLPDGGVRVEFPVDAESVANFRANGLAASVENTWAVELTDTRFVYELSRPNGRLFRVEFDLTRPVAAPPPPWGASGAH